MELSSLLFFFINGKIEDYERLGYLELLAVVVYIKPSKIWRKLKELCHGYCACLHLTDANDVNKAMFI